jgi:branched-chain amino acid transport system ATP-binding protein
LADPALLTICDLDTGYGKKRVLSGVSMHVRAREIVALIGPNGAGKSTVLKTICALLRPWRGEIRLDGEALSGLSPAAAVARGIAYAPQGSRVFDELTVMENLEVSGFHLRSAEVKARIEQVLETFPMLGKRTRQEAGRLSGGEQQMLALARAMIPRPKLLMLDEPSLGLSPGLVSDVFAKVSEINRNTGVSVLIVEQKVREVLDICQRAYSLKLGEVAFEGVPSDLRHSPDRLRELFL